LSSRLRADYARSSQKAVGEGGSPMVDVGDDAGVPYDFWAVHQLYDFFNLLVTRHN
jgi:hypothetical protein